MTDTLNRAITRLAVPALGALIAEPLFLIVDAALVGHLGTVPLAGLGIASAVLQTIIGLMVFLAYSTTPAVARRFGEGDMRRAVAVGIDGMWLAVGIGAVIAAVGYWATPAIIGWFGAAANVATEAETYLSISMWGLPAMLVVFAATGLLRGLQNTTIPLWIAGAGFTANALLNWLFIYGFGWGIGGSAMGTVVAQWGMVVAFTLVVARLAKQHGASTRPQREGLRTSARSGSWMFVRNIALRAAFLATVVVATGLGTEELAGYQVVFTIFTTAAFALDALAIAAQALVGKGLGEQDQPQVQRVVRRVIAWGLCFGVIVGVLIAACSGVIGLAFTGDPRLAALVQPALLLLAIAQPLAAVVFVLDGILIGAGDAKYLALAGLINLVPTIPALIIVHAVGVSGSWGLVLVALCFFVVFMAARFTTLTWRLRSGQWMNNAV